MCLVFELLSSHAANTIARNRRNSFSDVHSSKPRSQCPSIFPKNFSLSLSLSRIIFKGSPRWSETHGSRACIQLAVTPTLKSDRGTGWVARGSAYRPPPLRCALYSRCRIGGASVLHVQRNLARCVKYTVAPLSPCIWIFQQDLSTLSPR